MHCLAHSIETNRPPAQDATLGYGYAANCGNTRCVNAIVLLLRLVFITLRLLVTGVESVITCEVRASIAKAGTYLDRHAIKLVCYLCLVNPEAMVSLDEW